jgi:hypothetical protein
VKPLVASLLLFLWTAGTAEWRTVEVGGLTLKAPQASEVTDRQIRDGHGVVAVTWKEEVLVFSVYSGAQSPSAARALATHVEELEREVLKGGPFKSAKARHEMMGRRRKGMNVRYARGERDWQASVVAVRREGVTVVATWSGPRRGSGRAFAPKCVAGLTLK